MFADWLRATESTDDREIIEHVRGLDESLVPPVAAFLDAHSDHFDDPELVEIVRNHLPREIPDDKVRVYLNTNANMSRGKVAAQVAHAVLTAAGVRPGLPIVVLGAKPSDIENKATVIRDAGHTELEPGTLTAGTDWVPRAPAAAHRIQETTLAGFPPAANHDTSRMPLPAFLAMAEFIADNPTMMAPPVISQTIRDLMARLEQQS
jgi:PTH2 family peptidyl-tRNA hydrolase